MTLSPTYSRILLILLTVILAEGERRRKDSGYFEPIIFPDDEDPPKERISRGSSSSDLEFYTPDYPKKFFFAANRNSNSSIIFPSHEMQEDAGIPPRFSRPSVDESGVLTFSLSPFEQTIGSVPEREPSRKGPTTTTMSSVAVNLEAEQVLINERVDAFLEWMTQNKLLGDLPASEVYEAGSGDQSDFTLSNGGVLNCPPGQVRRNGACEQVAQF